MNVQPAYDAHQGLLKIRAHLTTRRVGTGTASIPRVAAGEAPSTPPLLNANGRLHGPEPMHVIYERSVAKVGVRENSKQL
jgi:hypothetical protein